MSAKFTCEIFVVRLVFFHSLSLPPKGEIHVFSAGGGVRGTDEGCCNNICYLYLPPTASFEVLFFSYIGEFYLWNLCGSSSVFPPS